MLPTRKSKSKSEGLTPFITTTSPRYPVPNTSKLFVISTSLVNILTMPVPLATSSKSVPNVVLMMFPVN